MTSLRLTAVIITHNEELNIGRCIESLKPVVDEFVIIDSHSTDNTQRIIESHGIPLVSRQWEGYSATKNYGNSLAQGEYILSIDADEVLSGELQKSILAFKTNGSFDSAEVIRLTNYCGQWIRHSGWYPEHKVRIFRKGAAAWQGAIHEELIFKTTPTKTVLKGDLLHYSYPTVESHFRKIFSYAKLAAEKQVAARKSQNLVVHGLMKPWFMFVRKYFFQLGILDGFYGFVIAVISSVERFMRYIYYRQLKKQS